MLVGLLLLFLAGQLGRRKHRAWQVAVVLFGVDRRGQPGPARPVRCPPAVSAAMLVLLRGQPPASSRRRPTRRRCSSSSGSCPLYFGGGVRSTGSASSSPSATTSPRPRRVGRSIDAIFSGLVGPARALRLPQRVLRAGLPGLAARPPGCVGPGHRPGPAVPPHRGPPAAGGGRLGARQPPGAHLRHRHPGLLRPARRQELLLLLRRRGHDRLHLHRALRPGLGRPDRPARVDRAGHRRVPGHVPPAGLGRGLPGRARVRRATCTSTAGCTPSTWATRRSWTAGASASRARSGRACASRRNGSSAPTASR